MTGVIYARYSSSNQREESIDGQLRECNEFAKEKGITIVKNYIDRALSAKTDKRPQFQQMIKDSSKGIFDVVIVWKLDRFSRNRYDSAHYKHILKKNLATVVSAKENISDDPNGIFMESVIEGCNEYYSADLSQKVKRGLKENALKCVYNGGRVPFGFVIDKDKHFQADSIKAPIVADIFKLYNNGKTMQELVNYLNEKYIYIRNNKPFTLNVVSRLLKNRRYIGEYIYNDIVVPDAIPALVDKDLFNKVQETMKKNKKAPARHKAKDDYLLTTKLHCGKCKKYMVGESGTSKTGTVHRYYRCVNTKKIKTCNKKAVKKDWIENLVINNTLKCISNDSLIEKIANKIFTYLKKENTTLALLQKQLKEIDKGIENMVNAIQQGIITSSTKERLDKLETQKSEIKDNIAIEKANNIPICKEQIVFWLQSFRNLDLSKKEHKQLLIDCFINSIYLYDDKILITYNINDRSETLSLKDLESSDISLISAPNLGS